MDVAPEPERYVIRVPVVCLCLFLGALVSAGCAKDRVVTTFAGSFQAGSMDGQGSAARFNGPVFIARVEDGTLYVTEIGRSRIRAVTPGGRVSLFAGMWGATLIDGTAGTATFQAPAGLRRDWRGNLVVAQIANVRLVRIADGAVTTLAGGGGLISGFVDGPIAVARFGELGGIDVDRQGHRLFVADWTNHAIREIDVDSGEVRTLVGNGSPGFADGLGGRSGAARANGPCAVAFDSSQNVVWFNDKPSHVIRRVHLDTLQVETVAGLPGVSGYAEGRGVEARFNAPMGMALGPDGLLYVCDTGNYVIRTVARDGTTHLVAGTPGAQSVSDIDADGQALQARFTAPSDLAVAPDGTLFVVESNRIRVIQ